MSEGYGAGPPDDDAPVFVISVAATLAGLHPQTLRAYDRIGLVSPDRTRGRGRRYSSRDIAVLREVQRLSQDEGINLAGVKRILGLVSEVQQLQAQLGELTARIEEMQQDADRRERQVHQSYRRDLVPIDRAEVVVWRSKSGKADT